MRQSPTSDIAMTLFKRLGLLICLLLPLVGHAATMKIGDVINTNDVRWWGADPSGVSDSTAAISNALAWTGSGRLYVPRGTYKIITLHITNNFLTLYGDGHGASVFNSVSAAPMIVLHGNNATIEKLKLQGNGIATQGLHLTNSEQSVVREVLVDSIIGPGIFAQDSSFSLLFDRCSVVRSHIGMHLTNLFQNTRINHCLIYHNTNYQMILGSIGNPTRSVSIQDSELESLGTAATNLLVNDVTALVIDGVYFESTMAAAKDIVVAGTTSLVEINGMYANGNGTSTNSIFVDGNDNSVSLNNSFIFNYTTSPVITSLRSYIKNCSLNGSYFPMFSRGPIQVSMGSSASNFISGGSVLLNSLERTNHTGSGAFTNFYDFTIPANALTNDGDRVVFTLGGHFRYQTATTNDLRAILGGTTLFDTGFITASNCPWRVAIDVVRTGNSAQRVDCKVEWNVNAAVGSHGNGTLSTYSTNMPLALVNGVTNIFVFQGASRIPAAITNNYFEVEFKPGPR